MKKILGAIVMLLILFFVIVAMSDDTEEPSQKQRTEFADSYNKNDTWLIYWYICGSNLESEYGAATADIEEMMKVALPSNVKVIIQAGGSNEWKNAFVRSGMTNRLLYDSDGLHELQTTSDADMGSPDTLSSFLRFGKDNFQADHKVFIFWDHGGGSAFGVCHDERTENILSLNSIRDAFASVYDANEQNPPFEVIGFDACLMATFDTANTLHGYTRYMVASEELEPGNGWEYTGWLSKLVENPAMGGDGLGKAMCDAYYKGCEEAWSEDAATLSVVNVTRIPQLKAAYDAFGVEALRASAKEPKKFFSSFGRNAKKTEGYGGNNNEDGYYDMIDIGDLAEKSLKLLPQTSQNLIDAIDEAVVYQVSGKYRKSGNGISGFYPLDGGDQIYNLYAQQEGAPLTQKCLYYHLLYGQLPPQANDILNGNYQIALPQPTQKKKIFDIDELEDHIIKVDKDNNAYVKLTEEEMNILSDVRCNLARVQGDIILNLGTDANIKADWEKGRFTDNFQAKWPMLDGHPVYIEVTEHNKDYNLYSIPIKLNGMKCNLQVAYDYKANQYKILGARRGAQKGMSDKNLIKLKDGDQITTIHYGLTVSGNDSDFTAVEVDTFTIGENPKFKDESLSDGEYLYCFEFITPSNDSASSQYINFTVKDKKIFTSQID